MAEPLPTMHPSDDALELYSLGRLSAEELPSFEEHLLVCEPCRARLEETDKYLAELRQALASLREEPAPKAWWSIWWNTLFAFPKPLLAVCATAIAILLVFPLVQSSTSPYTVELRAIRSAAEPTTTAPPGRLILRLSSEGLRQKGAVDVSVWSSSGSRVWSGKGQPSSRFWTAGVNTNLPAGSYWVRVHSTAQPAELLREYALLLE